MEKKNYSKMLSFILIVFVLGTAVGGTFTYFAVSFQDDRMDNETIVKTEGLPDAVVISNIDKSAGKFSTKDIYPGHKEVASLSASANDTLGIIASY